MKTVHLKRFILYFLVAIIIGTLATIPILFHDIHYGSDTTFHINRFIAYAHLLKQGILHPYIYPFHNYHYGYPIPSFYSDFFFIIPSYILNQGVPIITTYRIFIWLIFCSCSFSMLYCLSKLKKTKLLINIFCTIWYVFSNYSYQTTLSRGGIGEALSLIFIPLIFLGMYQIIQKQQIPIFLLTIGFVGLLLSHNISFIVTLIIFIIFCFLNILFFLKNQKQLGKVVYMGILSFLLTVFYSLPLIEQLQTKYYRISYYFNDTTSLHESSVKLIDLFHWFGLKPETMGNTIHILLFLIPILIFIQKRPSKPLRLFTIIGYVLIIMTTTLFPWDFLPFFSFLQFPHRLFNVAVVPLCFVTSYLFSKMVRNIPDFTKKRFIQILSICTLFTIGNQLIMGFTLPGLFNKSMNEGEFKENFYINNDEAWYDLMQLSTPDYLPYEKQINYLNYEPHIQYQDQEIKDYIEREDGTIITNFLGNGTYLFPKTFYLGYSGYVKYQDHTSKPLKVTMDEVTGLAQVDVQGIEQGETLVLTYSKTLIQKLSMGISLATLVISIILNFVVKRKKRFQV